MGYLIAIKYTHGIIDALLIGYRAAHIWDRAYRILPHIVEATNLIIHRKPNTYEQCKSKSNIQGTLK